MKIKRLPYTSSSSAITGYSESVIAKKENSDCVVRAIASSNIATISAIGHETDFTIADFIADLRAPTPTAAAEMVSRELSLFFENLASFQQDLFQIMQNKTHEIYQQIDQYEKRLLSPHEKIKTQKNFIQMLLSLILKD